MATTTKKPKTTKPAMDNGQPEETPEQRFQRLAQARTTVALKRIALIGNLGGTGYVSTEEQRSKIIDALTDAVNRVKVKLAKEKAAETVFTL